MEAPFISEWLRDAIFFSRTAISNISSTSLNNEVHGPPGPPQQRDPRFRKLVEGVHFSKKLILTYNAVLIIILILVAAGHWSRRAYTWRRRRKQKLEHLRDDVIYDDDAVYRRNVPNETESAGGIEGSSSSGSSTLEGGTLTSHVKELDESTPLLHTLQPTNPKKSLFTYMTAFLMYQPRPIPFINKTLPSNGYTLAVIGFILLNVFYSVYRINFTIFELFVLADRASLVFVANLPLLYLLAAKTEPITTLTGWSYEELNIIHRRLGEILCLEALVHSSGMIGVWYTILRPSGYSLAKFLLEKIIVLGILAFISYEVLYFTSLSSFRKRWYELFLGLHVSLQITALALVFFHHSAARIYVGIALGIFLIDRLVYRLWFKSMTFASTTEIMEDEETVRLSTTIKLEDTNTMNWILGRRIRAGWNASDHVFLTIPSLGRKHILQAHPFTILSPAPVTGQKEANLDLLIRAQSGFSSDLLQDALQRKTLTIRLDGPYGSHHARELLQESDIALVIAGGSGIAVCWPLVDFLLQEPVHRDIEAVSTVSQQRQKIVLIWVIHRAAHRSWIGQTALQELSNKGVQVIVPHATEEVGRPDLEAMIVTEAGDGKRIGVVGSGPDGMGRTVRNTCAKMVRNGRNVGVCIEKFGW